MTNVAVRSILYGRSWNAGVPQDDGYVWFLRGTGTLVNGTANVRLRIAGSDTVIVDANGMDIQPGKNLRYNGTAVLASGVLTAAAHPALTGDITSAAGSLATTIANNAVTYGKIAQAAGKGVVGAEAAGNHQLITFGTNTLDISGGVMGFAPTVAFNNVTVTGTGTVNSLLSTAGGIGYGTGAGGAVVQATSKSTAVTLNKASGRITTHNAALAASAIVEFTVNNSLVAATDTINLNLASGAATATSYRYWVSGVSAGSFKIVVENRSAGSLSEALAFNFAILKAVNA